MKKIIKDKSLITSIVLMVLFVSFHIFAWEGPKGNPPEYNAPAPINVGVGEQTFESSKIVNMGENNTKVLGVDGALWVTGVSAFDENVSGKDPVEDDHLATKRYVDAQVLGDYDGPEDDRSKSKLDYGIGFPRFAIQSTSWKGHGDEIEYRIGGNAICRSEFGDSSVMFGTQHVNCYSAGTCILDYRVTEESWFDETDDTLRDGTRSTLSYWLGYMNNMGWNPYWYKTGKYYYSSCVYGITTSNRAYTVDARGGTSAKYTTSNEYVYPAPDNHDLEKYPCPNGKYRTNGDGPELPIACATLR
jgi:hypothetical protein